MTPLALGASPVSPPRCRDGQNPPTAIIALAALLQAYTNPLALAALLRPPQPWLPQLLQLGLLPQTAAFMTPLALGASPVSPPLCRDGQNQPTAIIALAALLQACTNPLALAALLRPPQPRLPQLLRLGLLPQTAAFMTPLALGASPVSPPLCRDGQNQPTAIIALAALLQACTNPLALAALLR